MAEQQETYVRLPGRAHRQGGLTLVAERNRLWLGSDHLLHVTGTRYRETYKRFYFRDIQALSLRRTHVGAVLSIVLASFAVLLVAIGLLVETQSGEDFRGVGIVLLGAPAAVCLLFFGLNMAFGPTCLCHLHTAVHMEELPCLGRLHTAEEVFDRLKAVIEGVQGRVAPEVAQQRPVEGPMVSGPVMVKAPVVIRHSYARVHEVLMYLLFIDLIPTALAFVLPDNLQIASLNYMTGFGVLGCAIAAAVLQRRTDIPKGIKAIPWILIGFSAVCVLIGTIQGFTILAEIFARAEDPSAVVSSYLASLQTNPLILGLTAIGALTNVSLGSIGLILLRDFRRRAQLPPPVATPEPPGRGNI